ncbi:MAG TPA: tetratricopeptide repeat protein [Thermoplasmata archaeon]|nr:tetratricopeptide repeat protein [Thermoplasmata archaeon]
MTYLPAEILDYVATHAPPPDSPYGVSQRELAKVFGSHPCSMSRPLFDLVQKGFLSVHRGSVRGGLRKQLVYAVTEPGRERLKREGRDLPLFSHAIPPPPNPFFGRKDELSELGSLSEPGRAVVFVEGGPGIGKSAFVSRHARRFRAGRVPFWFTVRPGHSARHFTSSLAHALATSGGQQLAYYSQLPHSPVGSEVADLAQRALGDRGLLMVVDDAHVCDKELQSFLASFVEALSPERQDLITLVGQTPPFIRSDRTPVHHVVLGGLDRAAAHELTDRRGGLADRFEAVYQATLGSPLLLQLAVSTPGAELAAQSLPAAAVQRLAPEEVLALLPIALATEPLPVSFLTSGGFSTEEVLNKLVQSGLAQRAEGGRIDLVQPVRAALLTRVGPSDERQAHLRLAAFYARSRRAEAVRERFLHFTAGESWKPALEILQKNERTLLSLGYSEPLRNSLRHLSLAIPRGAQRVRALRAEATLLRIHSEYGEAILSLRRAISEAEGDSKLEADLRLMLVDPHIRTGQLDEARSALDAARRAGIPTRRIQVLMLYSEGRIAEGAGDLPQAQQLYERAFDLGRRFKAGDAALEALAAWSRVATVGGEHQSALRIAERGLPEARQSGRMDIVFSLMMARARSYVETGQADLAEAEMRTVRTEAEALGYLTYLTYTLSGLCAMAVAAGKWTEVVGLGRQTVSLAERVGNNTVLGHTLAIMGTGELRQSHFQDARSYGERAVTILSKGAPSDSLIIARAYLCETYLEMGLNDLAMEQFSEVAGLAKILGTAFWVPNLRSAFEAKGVKAPLEGGAAAPPADGPSGTPG